jgi:o-succinylbenzoate synthase
VGPLAELSFCDVRLRLDPPLVNARGSWTERLGLAITLQDGSGTVGCGEASPLPGYSSDDVETSARALAALDRSLLTELTSQDDPAELLERVAQCLPEALSAARFALESAALDRLGRARGVPVWRLLRPLIDAEPVVPREVELAALLPSDDPPAALGQARTFMAAGVRTFKLKLGPDVPTPAQLATLAALRAELGSVVAVRLDANASLDPARLAESLRQLARHRPELLEEPIDLAGDDAGLRAALRASPVPIAFDESLRAPGSLERALSAPYADALVLKPTTLGGFRGCLALARRARAHGRGIVVSHTFEGAVGWAACAQLALALAPERAAGLWPRAEQCPEPGRSRLIQGGRLLPLEQPGLGVQP